MKIKSIFFKCILLVFIMTFTPLVLASDSDEDCKYEQFKDIKKALSKNEDISEIIEESEECKQISGAKLLSGFAVTGTNRHFGKPVWDLGGTVGTAGFEFVFGYNPGGNSPIFLTEDTPLDTLMAAGVDPSYVAFFGFTPEDVDQRFINVPLREVPVISKPDGQRTVLPLIQDVPAGMTGIALPNEPITLKQWLAAEGEAVFVCYDDETAYGEIKLKNLIPHGVYTVWVNFTIDLDGDGIDDRIGGGPFGGVPNALIADSRGNAKYIRSLTFCPQNENNFKILNVAYHSDGDLFGAVPDLPLGDLPGGTTVHAAVVFPFNVTPAQ